MKQERELWAVGRGPKETGGYAASEGESMWGRCSAPAARAERAPHGGARPLDGAGVGVAA